ncbi:MAG: hypothetical protein WBF69_03790 [Castellaniella sp.]|uniref:hypothetical protein n=1 Tax=Castellaniella sp. TaxID=1955812 RepID=UPI003C788D2F
MNIHALRFVLDIDGNGTIAGWEVIAALKWGFTLPGRLLVEGLGNIPLIANTFDIQASAATGYASFNGLLATGASLLFWVLILYGLTRIGAQNDTESAANTPAMSGRPRYRGPQPKKHHS